MRFLSGSQITDYRLSAIWVNSSELDPIDTWWEEHHPDMVENGRYYRRYERDDQTQFIELTFDEFKEIYETDTGFEFYSDYFPD